MLVDSITPVKYHFAKVEILVVTISGNEVIFFRTESCQIGVSRGFEIVVGSPRFAVVLAPMDK